MFEHGRLEPISREAGLESTKLRIETYGEVFTPEHTVKDMLNLIPEPETIDKTYLEPTCGNGNFLVEIISRKMGLCRSFNDYLVAVSSVYGIDIQPDNVLEARQRVLGVVVEGHDFSDEQLSKLNEILYRNIVLANFLDDKMLKLDNEGYLLDFATDRRLIPLVFKGGRYGAATDILENGGNISRSDIVLINKMANLGYTMGYMQELADYISQVRLDSRIIFQNWSITNEKLIGTTEYLHND